jgi:hypothetical protein
LAGHFRRYTLADICAVVRAAGFEIEFSSYLFRFLPVPIFLLRTIPYRLGLSRPDQKGGRVFKDHAAGGGMAEAAFSRLMDILSKSELANLDHKKPMCFGSSCLVVARVSKT